MTLAWNLVTKHLNAHDQLQEKIRQKISKLEQHLQHFPPDAVHLLVHLERHPKRDEFSAALTLRLPSNILHSRKVAVDPIPAFDLAVKALLRELAGFKSELRREEHWKRLERRQALREAMAVRFATHPQTGGPQSLADTLAEMIKRYHGRLLYHVQRQLWRDQLDGNVSKGAIDAQAVIDEVARQALAAPHRKPEDISYRAWLYSLIRRELKRRYKLLHAQGEQNVPIDETSRVEDEAEVAEGYDAEQPLEIIEEEIEPHIVHLADLMADTRAERPDDAAMEHDLVDYLHRLAKTWPAQEQAVFDLHFLEGFDEDEVAMVEKVEVPKARELIANVQARLRDVLMQATDRWVEAKSKAARS